jgi:hypothetical protein
MRKSVGSRNFSVRAVLSTRDTVLAHLYYSGTPDTWGKVQFYDCIVLNIEQQELRTTVACSSIELNDSKITGIYQKCTCVQEYYRKRNSFLKNRTNL